GSAGSRRPPRRSQGAEHRPTRDASGGFGLRSGLAGLAGKTLDGVAHLSAPGSPVLEALEGEAQGHFLAGRHRVVETDALDEAAVAAIAAIGGDDVVEGALLGAAARQSNDDHVAILVRDFRAGPRKARNPGKPEIVAPAPPRGNMTRAQATLQKSEAWAPSPPGCACAGGAKRSAVSGTRSRDRPCRRTAIAKRRAMSSAQTPSPLMRSWNRGSFMRPPRRSRMRARTRSARSGKRSRSQSVNTSRNSCGRRSTVKCALRA